MFLERTTTTLKVTGNAPSSHSTVFNDYDATISPSSAASPSVMNTGSGYEASFISLTPGNEYTVTVWTRSGEEKSDEVTAKFFTSRTLLLIVNVAIVIMAAYREPETPGAVSRHSAMPTTTEVLGISWVLPVSGDFAGFSVKLDGSKEQIM